MRHQRTLRLGVSVVLFLCAWQTATAQENNSPDVQHPALRRDLLAMARADQAVRQALLEKGMSRVDSLDVVRQDSVDTANQARLQEIIRRHGWPTNALVGKKGVEAAFLIVQHGEPAFQKKMLSLVHDAFERGEVPGKALALLTDRVLRGEEKPQRYGTQLGMKGDRLVLEPIENEENVDERRRAMGLPPLAEYLKKVEEVYGMEVVRK